MAKIKVKNPVVEMDGDETAGVEHVRNVGVPHPLLECRCVALGALESHLVANHSVISRKYAAKSVAGGVPPA